MKPGCEIVIIVLTLLKEEFNVLNTTNGGGSCKNAESKGDFKFVTDL